MPKRSLFVPQHKLKKLFQLLKELFVTSLYFSFPLLVSFLHFGERRRRSLRKYFQRCFRPVDSPLTLLRAFQETGAEQPAVYITKCQLEDAVSALWVFSSGCRTTPSVIFVSLQCTELLRCKQKAPGATNNT